MAPVMSELFGVNDFCMGGVSGWVMTSSQRIPHPQIAMVTKITKVNVICSYIEISSNKYLSSYLKWSLKLSDLN
jgi:hypothetical protein